MRYKVALVGSSIAFSIAALTGCGGSPTAISMSQAQQLAATTSQAVTRFSFTSLRRSSTLLPGQHKPTGILYVANRARNEIDIFPSGVAHPDEIGKIKVGIHNPSAIAVDNSGSLYVVNSYPRGNLRFTTVVTAYAAGSGVPNRTLEVDQRASGTIAVGPDETVYVTTQAPVSGQNHEINVGSPHFFINEFDAGTRTPSRIIKIPYYQTPETKYVNGLALDSSNKLYVNAGSGDDCCGYAVSVYLPKTLKAAHSFGFGFDLAEGALAIDTSADVLYAGLDHNKVLAVRLPLPRQPYREIHVSHDGGEYLAVDAAAAFLYVVSNKVAIYDLATGSRIGSVNTEDSSDPGGVAVASLP